MRPNPFLLLCFALALISFQESTLANDEFRVVKDLEFSDESLTLDLFIPKRVDRKSQHSRTGDVTAAPEESGSPVPCVIVIQGGGFLPQNGKRFRPVAEQLAENGFAAALISYRGRPKHRHRETLADVKDSVRFVRSVSKKYGIDAKLIGATGSSAGGTLAALLALTGDESDPASRIQAAVCFAGVFDFVGRFTDDEQLAIQPKT